MARDSRSEIEQLFRQYGQGVGNYILARVHDPELAEEITARVFLTVVRCWQQQRNSGVGWLWAIVRSELHRHYRSSPPLQEADAALPAPDLLPPEEAMRREFQASLQAALLRLAPEQRQIVDLKFQAGLRNQEIAAITGLTPSNVGVRLHRALKELRELLEVPAQERVRTINEIQNDSPS